MRAPWFKPLGWIYRPVSLPGYVTTLAALFFLIEVFLVIDRQAHSVSDVLYRFYPYATPTFLGLLWIATRTSGEPTGRR